MMDRINPFTSAMGDVATGWWRGFLGMFDGIEAKIDDLFWSFATSYPILGAIALVAAVAFVISHMPTLVERFLPILTPYIKAAAVVRAVAFFALIFLLGFRFADDRAEVEQLKVDLQFSNLMLESQAATALDAERLRREADAKAQEAKGQLDVWRKKFGGSDPDAAFAYSSDFLNWLRTRNSGRAATRAK